MARGTHRPSPATYRDLLDNSGLPVFPDLNLLAEGDSWFTINGLPPSNLLFKLRFRKPTRIVSCALPGDTIKHMAQIAGNQHLKQALGASGPRWDAILLSGGGNDLIDAAAEILLPKDRRPDNPKKPEEFCDMPRLRALVKDTQDGYRRIAALRDLPGAAGRGVPILSHTYDYATPRDAPARLGFVQPGPWLYKALTKRLVPPADWVRISDFLTNTLAEGILALAAGPTAVPGFHVVETRGTLIRADLDMPRKSNDWLNEIHPTAGGYDKLAKRIEPTLDKLLTS